MTDREMLELAAKAAGFNDAEWVAEQACISMLQQKRGFKFFWNPLTDDGDALRLAVNLGMHIVMYESGEVPNQGVTSVQANQIMIGINDNPQADWKGDPYAATRRAIVRAAAEIGKAMK